MVFISDERPPQGPQGPREALIAQTETLMRLVDNIERLTSVATNKNADLAGAVDAAREAIQAERNALVKGAAAYERAGKALSETCGWLDKTNEGLGKSQEKAVETARILASTVGHVRGQKAQRIALAAAFLAGLALPVIVSFIPGFRDYPAAWMVHETSRAQAGVTLIYDQAPSEGQAVAKYLNQAGVQ